MSLYVVTEIGASGFRDEKINTLTLGGLTAYAQQWEGNRC